MLAPLIVFPLMISITQVIEMGIAPKRAKSYEIGFVATGGDKAQLKGYLSVQDEINLHLFPSDSAVVGRIRSKGFDAAFILAADFDSLVARYFHTGDISPQPVTILFDASKLISERAHRRLVGAVLQGRRNLLPLILLTARFQGKYLNRSK